MWQTAKQNKSIREKVGEILQRIADKVLSYFILFSDRKLSAFYHKTVLSEAINNENNGNVSIYYINKNETAKLYGAARVPMPKVPHTNNGFLHSITESDSPGKKRI